MLGRGKGGFATVLALALCLLLAVVTSAGARARGPRGPIELESAAFAVAGSNGYRIIVSAYSLASGRGRVTVWALGKQQSAVYSAPAEVTPTMIDADLGALGRIDVVLHPSGTKKIVRPRCVGVPVRFEPGIYEGTIEFNGEDGYTRVDQTGAARQPLPFVIPLPCHGSGSGESLNDPRLPGARLRGISYAHGRNLRFQINKNRPSARAVFTASLRERHGGIVIGREIHGSLPAGSFSFDHRLRTAVLDPPAPFSGRASLLRSPDLVQPLLHGDLSLDFPGKPSLPLVGPDVFISLVHARLTRSDSSTVTVGFRSPSTLVPWPTTKPLPTAFARPWRRAPRSANGRCSAASPSCSPATWPAA